MANALKTTTAFTGDQYDLVYPKGIERHFWCIARNGILSDMIRWIERRAGGRIGRLLEIGCGRGMVVEHLRLEGRDCYGVELSPVGVPEDRRTYVWSGTDCRNLPASFRAGVEAVLLLEVIEHIEDARRFLIDIRDAFPACRWLIVSVPARAELWSNFDEEFGHFRRYDEEMLAQELADAGATLLRWRYRFALLYPLIYALLRIGKPRPLSNKAPSMPMLHRVLGGLIRRETWIMPQRVYGTSIYAIAEFPGRMPGPARPDGRPRFG
ncbi:MAG: class I SAM-dependent methyltransferase [Alphaproteobacteria bacterium]|nr:class I SAM-dependent methyltransferase [Alphaproteobacteria bacterium]